MVPCYSRPSKLIQTVTDFSRILITRGKELSKPKCLLTQPPTKHDTSGLRSLWFPLLFSHHCPLSEIPPGNPGCRGDLPHPEHISRGPETNIPGYLAHLFWLRGDIYIRHKKEPITAVPLMVSSSSSQVLIDLPLNLRNLGWTFPGWVFN